MKAKTTVEIEVEVKEFDFDNSIAFFNDVMKLYNKSKLKSYPKAERDPYLAYVGVETYIDLPEPNPPIAVYVYFNDDYEIQVDIVKDEDDVVDTKIVHEFVLDDGTINNEVDSKFIAKVLKKYTQAAMKYAKENH
jgi:hypothetical protein